MLSKRSRWVVLIVAVVALAAAVPSQSAAKGPSCTKQAARHAVPRTRVGARYISQLNGAPWVIGKLLCAKLMGPRAGTDMAVMLECCTAASPTPLIIFKPKNGGWTSTYQSSVNVVIDSLKLQGSSLIESRPVFGPNDPLCCPSGHHKWSVRWNGRSWVVRRV